MKKVCNGCHGEFYLSDFYRKGDTYDGLTSRCKSCIKQSKKRYYEAHRSKILERHAKWYSENREDLRAKAKAKYSPEKNRQQCKAYYESNKEKVRQINDNWSAANTDKVREYSLNYGKRNRHIRNAWASKRRAAMKQAYGWNIELTDFVAQEAQWVARELSASTGISHHVDHIIPINGENVSGLHVWNNLRVITAIENQRKSNKLVEAHL